MILAVQSAGGGQGAQEVIDRLSLTRGRPRATINDAFGLVASWKGPSGIQIDRQHGWLAEGWIDSREPRLSPGSFQLAKGDFALFGLSDGGVFVASGRAGGYRPIYVSCPSPMLVIACSHLSPLLELLPQRPPLDLDYLSGSLLSREARLPESTPYIGVQRVPMGEAWLVRPGLPAKRWSTLAPLSEAELRDDDDLPARLRQAITEATLRSTRNAARLAVGVSGGLDSSMLLSLLVSLSRAGEIAAPPAAFSYASEAPSWHDDGPYLQAIESHVGVRAHRIAPANAAASIGEFMVVDAAPAPSAMLFAARLVGTVARAEGVDVILVGDGGDQVLDGNPRLYGELARRGQVLRAIDGASRTRGAFYHGRVQRLARFVLTFLDPLLPKAGLQALRRREQRMPPWAGPTLAHHFDLHASAGAGPATLRELPGDRYARLLRWPATGTWSLMRHQEEIVGGYATRSPLLDDDFLRFAATIPPLSLMRGGFLRGLMREAMRGLVPDNVRLRETKGTFYFFIEQALAVIGGLDALADLSNIRMLADLGLVEPKSFRKFFDSYRNADDIALSFSDLWNVLSVEAFLRQTDIASTARAA